MLLLILLQIFMQNYKYAKLICLADVFSGYLLND